MARLILLNQTEPDTPPIGYVVIYPDSSNKHLKAKDDAGTVYDLTVQGVTDHTLLSNIGTNTHAQIDSHIADSGIHTDWSQPGAGTIHSSNYVDNDTVYTHPNHSGDVVSSGDGAQTISNNAVTNEKAADMAANSIKGNNTGGVTDPADLTATQVTAMLNAFTSSLKGLAPASGGGTTNFLRADGTWASPGSSTFGSDRTSTNSASESTTTSATYQQKLKLTHTYVNQPYIVMWYAEARNGDADDAVECRLQFDDTTDYGEIRFYSGDVGFGAVDWLDDFQPFVGFNIFTPSAASHDLDIDFRSLSGGTAYIRRARITIWRLA